MTTVLPAEVNVARDLVEPALRRIVDELAPSMRMVVRYHFGWADENGRATPGGGGKALRPVLTLLSAQAAGAVAGVALPAAVAVELVHNFSLLHDDVIDGDVERRHRPTAWRVFGVPATILAGNALLVLAVETVRRGSPATAASELVGCLNKAVQDLIVGQSTDVEFERRRDVRLTECLAMVTGKTGALLRCAASIGALAANAPEATLRTLAEFGGHLGLAFQLTDDLLGIWGSPEVTGKPRLVDLRSRKKSIPVVVALNSESLAGKEFREMYFAADQVDDEDRLTRMADLVEEAGGLSFTEQEASRYVQLAEDCLDRLDAPTSVLEALRATAWFITKRDR